MSQSESLPKRHSRLHPIPLSLFIAVVLSTLTNAAQAEDVHEHGIADLLIAVDGNDVLIRLESPAANLLGFETVPASDQERAAVRQLIDDLRKDDLIKVTDGAGQCAVTPPSWTTDLFTEASLEASAQSAHAADKADTHQHGTHENHADHHGEEEQHAHADLDIEWQARCKTAPFTIEHQLFSRFAGLHDLRISLIGAQGQSAWKTNRSQPPSIGLDRRAQS